MSDTRRKTTLNKFIDSLKHNESKYETGEIYGFSDKAHFAEEYVDFYPVAIRLYTDFGNKDSEWVPVDKRFKDGNAFIRLYISNEKHGKIERDKKAIFRITFDIATSEFIKKETKGRSVHEQKITYHDYYIDDVYIRSKLYKSLWDKLYADAKKCVYESSRFTRPDDDDDDEYEEPQLSE